jgi:hypothetical protein
MTSKASPQTVETCHRGASRTANYQTSGPQFLSATRSPLRPGVTSETVNLMIDPFRSPLNA